MSSSVPGGKALPGPQGGGELRCSLCSAWGRCCLLPAPEAAVELLPGEMCRNRPSCCLQLGSASPAQPWAGGCPLGRDGASGAAPVPGWPVATGALLTRLLTRLLPRSRPRGRPGGADTAADGGEQVGRGAGSTPRRRQKREVPKPSAVENNQVARGEAAGG